MSLDIPRVEYLKEDKSETKQVKVNPNDKAFKLQEEANKRAKERRNKNNWTPIKLSDLPSQLNTDE